MSIFVPFEMQILVTNLIHNQKQLELTYENLDYVKGSVIVGTE